MTHITRQQVQDTLVTHLYIYADDRSEKAMRGQAAVFGEMPNCVPIYTRLWCCEDRAAQVWILPVEDYAKMLELECFEHIRWVIEQCPHKQVIICPKIGEGCSRLAKAAPAHYKIVKDFLDELRKKI